MKRVELPKPILEKYKYRTGQKDFVGGNPVTLESKHVRGLWDRPYNLTPKVDGTRYLCIIEADGKPYFIDRGTGYLRVFQPVHTNGNTPSPRPDIPICILDGEMIKEENKGRTRWIFWVFDILSFRGNVVADLNFEQRYWILLNEFQNFFSNPKSSPDSWFLMLLKPYYTVSFFSKEKDPYLSVLQVFKEHCKKLGLAKQNLDGLIFNDTTRPYVKGPWSRCDNIQFKWKPESEQTIDLRYKNKEFLDKRDKVYTFDFFKNGKKKEIGILEPEGLPRKIKDRIVELRITKVSKKGVATEFVRYRDDKSANALLTINSVINGYLKPVELTDLFSKNPKKILKYFTSKQLLRILNKNDLFSKETRTDLTKWCKAASKIEVRFPDKNIPIECLMERGFPFQSVTEESSSKGEFLILGNSLRIKKHQGKIWVPSEKITIKTKYLYGTPVEISSMKLVKPSGGSSKRREMLTKTIFRISGYTNIIFVKPQNKSNGTFYLESSAGEKPKLLKKIIKLILEL